MARVRIVARVLREDLPCYWHLDPRVQSHVYGAFARAGASAVEDFSMNSRPSFEIISLGS
jgi:hypothetical protein